MLWLLLACADPELEQVTACSGSVPGHGFRVEQGPCQVLPAAPADEEGSAPQQTEFQSSLDVPADWGAVNDALDQGPVTVHFAPETYTEPLFLDHVGTHILTLNGRAGDQRAVLPGVVLGSPEHIVSRVTLRGFEITGSAEEGVRADVMGQVELEDLVVHDNAGAGVLIFLHAPTSFSDRDVVLRGSHVFNSPKDCVIVRGVDLPGPLIWGDMWVLDNLIHDCGQDPLQPKSAVYFREPLSHVFVERNVLLRSGWGIHLLNPGYLYNNLISDMSESGLKTFPLGYATRGVYIRENVLLRPGPYGMDVQVWQSDQKTAILDNIVFDAQDIGVRITGERGYTWVDIVGLELVSNPLGLYSEVEPVIMANCHVSGNDQDLEGLFELDRPCRRSETQVPEQLSGPDAVWFTPDDPWIGLVPLPQP
ncbi:MAG: hypothetical protein ACI9VR_001507 [Cognaticolwellia sp.]|jgi:hypothetical protein